jgi:hypothetical protein
LNLPGHARESETKRNSEALSHGKILSTGLFTGKAAFAASRTRAEGLIIKMSSRMVLAARSRLEGFFHKLVQSFA